MTSLTDSAATPDDDRGVNHPDRTGGVSGVIPVIEERATIRVERHDQGGVRVRVITDRLDDLQHVDLASERVEVTRHAVGRQVDAIPEPRQDGDVLIVPVVEERAVVVTRLFLTEEIHIRRTRSTETVDVPVNLRRQRAVVETLEPGPAEPVAADRNGETDRPGDSFTR